jgi:hypothetical protein
MKTRVDQKADGRSSIRGETTADSVASSSSSTRVARTSKANTLAAAATTATRKGARHASDGRNSPSDGVSHGQAKRGRVVLYIGKARASVGLEMQMAKETAREKEKDMLIPPSRVASDSVTVSSSSGSRGPEGTSDTSLSMEMDEGDIGLADRSKRSWTAELPSLLGFSLSLSSVGSRSLSQKRMPLAASCWQRKRKGIRVGGVLVVYRGPLGPLPRLRF